MVQDSDDLFEDYCPSRLRLLRLQGPGYAGQSPSSQAGEAFLPDIASRVHRRSLRLQGVFKMSLIRYLEVIILQSETEGPEQKVSSMSLSAMIASLQAPCVKVHMSVLQSVRSEKATGQKRFSFGQFVCKEM